MGNRYYIFLKMKIFARIIRDSGPLQSSHIECLLDQVYNRNANNGKYSDREHLQAAVNWLETAQDISGDGGICGRYSLRDGWSSSYPETTGYIMPTFLALGEERYVKRADNCLRFLLSIQLPSGAFPGGEIAENKERPSVFNTAQIIHGLLAWYRLTGEEIVLKAAKKAGDWLLSIQDDDGVFRRHLYLNLVTTYSSHASCWLAELGEITKDSNYLEGAEKHLNWVLAQQDKETGWFDHCGFVRADHEARRSVTHTIAYTLWGVLYTSEILGRQDGISAVRKAAERITRRLELSKRLPGVLNYKWKSAANFLCLTGNVQMALVWMKLHRIEENLRFLNAAFKAIDSVKFAQCMEGSNPALLGGIPGSDPIWGDYIYNAIPNWSAKFLVDAILEKERILEDFTGKKAAEKWSLPADVPEKLPKISSRNKSSDLRIIFYTSPHSKKIAEMMTTWNSLELQPEAIIVEHQLEPPISDRLKERIRNDGIEPVVSKFIPGRKIAADEAIQKESVLSLPNPVELAEEMNIPFFEVPPLSTPESLELVRGLKPDLAIQAGANGILRASLLELPRLGTLNAHMGLLPFYRGVNVTEWAALMEDPVGSTVHLIDPGVDTGDILCVKIINPEGVRSINQLRDKVNNAQLALLGDVLSYIIKTGELPPRRSQFHSEGFQFFRMHENFKTILERKLNSEK